MKVSNELLEKYNVQVPRYTSYPPANHFNDTFSGDDYTSLITASNLSDPNHIGFYIHIPFCKQICFYCGCNFIVMVNDDAVKKYIDAVKEEIRLTIKDIDKSRKVTQIHYGGGTPNAINSVFLKELNQLLFDNFEFIDNPEIAIECNPALLTWEYMDQLFDAGFNRFSFGIQDFDPDILRNVNRLPSALPVDELIQYVKKHDPKMSVNLDFIYGLPQQDAESFGETIKKAIAMRPDRIVTFSYAHVPWMKTHQRILEKKGLPNAEEKMEMFLTAYKLMKDGGYIPIGLDHYALPEDELAVALNDHKLHRNFQGYCTKRTTGQVYGFGVSSIGQLTEGYAQNTKDQFKYISQINKGILPVEKGYKVKAHEIIIREVINELMCNKYINWDKLGESLNISADKIKQTVGYNAEVLESFKADDLLSYNENEIHITELGTVFIRNIVAAFDPALKQSEKQYSKSL